MNPDFLIAVYIEYSSNEFSASPREARRGIASTAASSHSLTILVFLWRHFKKLIGADATTNLCNQISVFF